MKAVAWILVSVLGTLSVSSSVQAKSRTVSVDASAVKSRSRADHGTIHVFMVEVPRELSESRLDMVLLEFQVDVELDQSEHPDMTPLVAAYPLEQPLAPAGLPLVSSAFGSARNVRAGSAQIVHVDITDIARGWIDDPSTNYGLAVGSFTGPKLTKLDLKSNFIGAEKAARVTFYYQDRFGE